MLVLAIGFALLAAGLPAHAQTVRVSGVAWHALSEDEKAAIQAKGVVEALPGDSFGAVLDNQGVDKSMPGSTAGSGLGQAVASAAYIDKSFDEEDYSAKGHLAALLLGGIAGSALNSAPQSKYHFRYAIRLANGAVVYHDQISGEPFRHPAGVCVTVPALTLLREQHLCGQTADSLRQTYLSSDGAGTLVVSNPRQSQVDNAAPILQQSSSASSPPVLCKAGALAPVRTSAQKCTLIGGAIVNE